MSRGLGRMQRTILECLEPAKAAHARGELRYHGGSSGLYGHNNAGRRKAGEPPVVYHRGRLYTLGPDHYDLRATLLYAAITDGRGLPVDAPLVHFDVEPGYRVSFCRAVRSLIRRGLLEPVGPAEDGQEIRFVSRPARGAAERLAA